MLDPCRLLAKGSSSGAEAIGSSFDMLVGFQLGPPCRQGLRNEARGAKGCARTRELRCGLNLWPELAELSRLSSLAAEGLPDSVVVAAFTRLRVLISASVEAALHTEQACVVG